MIVRELVTLMGYKVDKKGEKKAQDSFSGLKKAASALGAIFANGIVASGLRMVLNLGSDAAETMNVITASFEHNTDAVLEWASVQAKEMGRSEFALRDYAAQLGAVLGPMTGSADAAAEMSTTLAQLTVDLGSFFNAAEPDVLIALRSGISGEAEPLKRFGIVMNVAALEAFAMSEGISKSVKNMSEGEKVALRYRFILDRTTKAQGDAAKTAGGYANLTKALEAVITDLGTEIGMMLLPAAEAVLSTLIDLVRFLSGPILSIFRTVGSAISIVVSTVDDLATAITGVEGALKIYAAVAAVAWAVSTAPILVTIALLAALAFAIMTIIEDLEAIGEGDESVIGGLIGEFEFLLDETDSIFGAIGGLIGTAVDFWLDKLFGFRVDAVKEFEHFRKRAGEEIDKVFAFVGELSALQSMATGAAARTAVGGAPVAIYNAIETTVNAVAGTDAGRLAEETSGRVAAGTDRLLRQTDRQLAIGAGWD